MVNEKKLIVSHAPFWHNGSSLFEKNCNIMIAALPAVLFGFTQYGIHAVGCVSICISTAIIWELLFNLISKQQISVGDCDAAVIGLLFSMLIPATTPWWAAVTGTFVAIIIGKQIYGGIGSNPFNPVLIGLAILMISWKDLFDFNEALLNYDLGFTMVYPLAALKHFGISSIESFSVGSFIAGKQIGAIGSTFGIGIIVGGIYLILRGIIRWEISVSFLAGIFITAFLFNLSDSAIYAGPLFHIFTGYTLIGAFFLATEDSSSPVNFLPMLIYGAGCGIMTVLIRNVGAYVDGVVFAILLMNLANPLIDKIRPRAMGKVN